MGAGDAGGAGGAGGAEGAGGVCRRYIWKGLIPKLFLGEIKESKKNNLAQKRSKNYINDWSENTYCGESRDSSESSDSSEGYDNS